MRKIDLATAILCGLTAWLGRALRGAGDPNAPGDVPATEAPAAEANADGELASQQCRWPIVFASSSGCCCGWPS